MTVNNLGQCRRARWVACALCRGRRWSRVRRALVARSRHRHGPLWQSVGKNYNIFAIAPRGICPRVRRARPSVYSRTRPPASRAAWAKRATRPHFSRLLHRVCRRTLPWYLLKQNVCILSK